MLRIPLASRPSPSIRDRSAAAKCDNHRKDHPQAIIPRTNRREGSIPPSSKDVNLRVVTDVDHNVAIPAESPSCTPLARLPGSSRSRKACRQPPDAARRRGRATFHLSTAQRNCCHHGVRAGGACHIYLNVPHSANPKPSWTENRSAITKAATPSSSIPLAKPTGPLPIITAHRIPLRCT